MPPVSPISPDPLLETQVFWVRYRTPILLGLVLSLCLLAAFGGYRLYTAQRDAAAAGLLSTAKAPADFQKVIGEYPSSPAAASASLLLADAQRREQKYSEANATLQAFLERNPKHEFTATAKMAVAGNLESLGKADEALDAYRRLAAEDPRGYNAPFALLAEVHLLKQKGQLDEARRVCETVLTQYRESYAAQEASQQLRLLKPAPAPETAKAPMPAPSASVVASPTAAAVASPALPSSTTARSASATPAPTSAKP